MRSSPRKNMEIEEESDNISLSSESNTTSSSPRVKDKKTKGSVRDVLRCANVDCKKIALKGCYLKLCNKCCEMSPKGHTCQAHASRKAYTQKKRESDAQYLEAAIASDNLKKRGRMSKFEHPEDKFTDYNQTVVIWCFKDFLRNQTWNDDTLNKLEKKRRLDLNAAKRGHDFDKSLFKTMKTRKYYDDRYENTVKVEWDQQIPQTNSAALLLNSNNNNNNNNNIDNNNNNNDNDNNNNNNNSSPSKGRGKKK